VGFEPQMLTVTNYPDEGAITAVLTRAGVALPAVTSRANRLRGPADTSRKLDQTGFYDRRDKMGASPMAFVLGEKLVGLMTFDDFGRLTGRTICESNLFVDGVRVRGTDMTETLGLRGKNPIRITRKNMADQFVHPENVLAIENYRIGEVPVEYNQTKAAGGSHDCGATLIWTK
jgi:hypothetical protein